MSIRKREWTKGGEKRMAWVVDYFAADPKTGERKRHLKTFKTQRAAKDWWEGTAAREVRTGTHTPASKSLTVAETGKLWIADGEAEGREGSTIAQRHQHVVLHINPHIGTVKLADLIAPRVQTFLDQLRDKGMSPAMRRKVLVSLKTLLSFAQGRGLVAQNVARGIRLKVDKRRETRDIAAEMPTKAELRTMMDKAPPRWRAFVVTAIFTGMRASELRGLTWDHVDLEEGIIRVRQRADRWNQIGPCKSEAGYRDIPLAPMAINALKEWKLAYPRPVIGRDEKGKPMREEHRPGHLVFPNGQGHVESHGNIWRRVFAPIQVDNGIAVDTGRKDKDGNPILEPKYGLHALRHAAASLFIEQGWLPKKVQTVLGHASIQMTYDLYGKLFKDGESDRKAMERMQAALMAG